MNDTAGLVWCWEVQYVYRVIFIYFQMIAREYLTNERRESRAEITVHIEDVNDNWPQFSKEQYSAAIKENPPRDTFVAQIQVMWRRPDDRTCHGLELLNVLQF